MNKETFSILVAKVLNNEANAEEIADLQCLIAENQELKTLYLNLHELWNSKPPKLLDASSIEENYKFHLERLLEQCNDFEAAENIQKANQGSLLHPEIKKWHQQWQSYAAAFVFLFALFYSYGVFNLNNKVSNNLKPNKELIVNKGAKSKLMLPDGSHVWVNADSKLIYPESFDGPTREVYLEGEGYFDIIKDPAHPFIVHTSGIDIRVLGTIFNVKAYPKEIISEASLIKGSIEVTLKNGRTDKIMLKPTEKITVFSIGEQQNDPNKETVQKTGENLPLVSLNKVNYDQADSLVNEIAWVQNKLVFNNESLGSIIVLLERWYGEKIAIKTLSHKELRFTGKFNNETIDQVLNALQLSHRFSYKRENGIIIIS